MISTCSRIDNLTSPSSQITDLCDLGSNVIVYDKNNTAYRNKYCVMCNELDEQSLFCEPMPKIYYRLNTVPSYRLLVDFNSHQYKTTKEGNEVTDSFEECSSQHEEIYDPVSKTCRKLHCPSTFTAIKGKCVRNNNFPNNTNTMKSQCAFIKLKSDEYEILNLTHILVLSLNKTVGSSLLFRNGSEIYVCEEMFTRQAIRHISSYFGVIENYVSFGGIICSIASLVLTLLVYIMLSELRNIPGKNLISLMIALLLAQLLFLCSNQAVDNYKACKALAIIIHYCFLASFSWMNVIAYDLFRTFSHSCQLGRLCTHMSKVFYRYSVYGWLIPAAIVTPAVLLDIFSINNNQFKPRYGENVCWISSKNALILFFVGPLAVFKLIDFVGFICTSFYISKTRRQGSMARQYNVCSCLLYLKLSLIMGLTWLFAFVAVFSNDTIMWYLFIIFNTLQGVFIALSFLCTKRVIKLISGKLERRQNVDSSSGTLIMQLKRSNIE
ncbi:adhesion G-protein coupled receptor G2-like [Mercenaria mercenaria]|uniref:adhesion G-protein coupled receptor G2-like n=1 Tax=Mercenaria mercenaria TaxID=6596 RepID=UPI00234F862E|nr:adhesion G-protein coupled receptor G2-like [Mercenaria mercenaria]